MCLRFHLPAITSFPAHIQSSLLNPLLIYPSFLVSVSQAMPRCLSSPTFPFHLPVILQETSCCHNMVLSTQLCFRPVLGSDQRASSSSSRGLPQRVVTGAPEEPLEQGWSGTRSSSEQWCLCRLRAMWACSAALHSSNQSSKKFLPKRTAFLPKLSSSGQAFTGADLTLVERSHKKGWVFQNCCTWAFLFKIKSYIIFFKRGKAPSPVLDMDMDRNTAMHFLLP